MTRLKYLISEIKLLLRIWLWPVLVYFKGTKD
jgi:hypothetical protein